MKKQILVIGIIAALVLPVVLFWPSKTPEQIQAKPAAKLERERQELEAEIEIQKAMNERLKLQAEIEAQKPVEVRVAEEQTEAVKSQTSVGDAILGTAGIAAGAYIFGLIIGQ